MIVGVRHRRALVLLPGLLLLACGGGLDDLSSGSNAGGAGSAAGGRAGNAGNAGANGGAAGKGATGGATSLGGSGGGVGAGTGGGSGTATGVGGAASGSGGGTTAGTGGSSGANTSGSGGTGGTGGSAGTGGSGGTGGTGGTSSGKGGTAGNAAAGASGNGLGGSGTAGTGGGSAGSSGSGGAPCSPGKLDPDCDGVSNDDNCPNLANLDQSDQDADGNGDACDTTPGGPEGSTKLGSCGVAAGKPAIVLESVTPGSVCPGDVIQVAYKAAVPSCVINEEVDFRLHVSGTGNDGGAFGSGGTQIASADELVGTKSITLSKSLAPNDYFLELSAGGGISATVRSKRLPLTVGGKGVSATFTIDNGGAPLLLEHGAYPAQLVVSTPGPYRVLAGSTQISAGTGPATSNISLSFPQAGNNTYYVEMTAADGCKVQRAFTFDVLTCNPKMEASTKTSTDADTTITNLWVCGNTTYTGTSRHVYVQPTGTFAGKASSNAVLWLPTGGVLGPAMTGTWTILHAGAAPVVPAGVKATLVACSSMSFDGSSASQNCGP